MNRTTTIHLSIDGQEILVTITGLHVADEAIEVEARDPGERWHPVNPSHVDVRHE